MFLYKYKLARLQQKFPTKVYLVLEWRTCKGQESSAVVAANRNTKSVRLLQHRIASIQTHCFRKHTFVFKASIQLLSRGKTEKVHTNDCV